AGFAWPCAARAGHRGDRRERAHPDRQPGNPSRAHHGARGDGVGIFRPPPRADRSVVRTQTAALYLADRLPVRAVGHRRTRRQRAGARHRRSHIPGEARGRRLPAGRVRDRDLQNARVQGAGIPGRGADARPARHLADVCLAESLEHARHILRRRTYAGGLAGAGELHADLPGPALRVAQYLRVACLYPGRIGRLAGLHPGCAASLSDGDDRAGVQGHRHPGGAAPDHRASRHPPRDRNRGRRRPRHAARHGAGCAVNGGDAAGDRGRRPAGARGPRLRAVGGAARPIDDGDTAQRRKPSDRLHVAGKRPGAGGHRRQRHAAGGRNQHRLFGADRLHRHRHLPVPDSRAFRHRRRAGARSLPWRAAMIIDALSGVLLIPALSACLLAALPGYRLTSRLNVLAAFLSFATAASLFVVDPQSGPYLLVDDLNKVFIVLTTFVAFTTSVFSASYIGHEIEIGRLKLTYVRFYHSMYQVLMFGMNLALVANNIGLRWVAIGVATLTTVLMVGIYRTHEALEAAWKYFILGSVGIALALFGTILIYMAARPVIGEGLEAMVWTVLLALNPVAIAPGPLMVTMGLISCVFAAFMLYRRRDIKRMFAYSSIEHMGIIVFAFGMGGPLANFAALLHMTMHSLTKSAIFYAVGHIAQVKGTQKIADMGGLTVTNPVLGW